MKNRLEPAKDPMTKGRMKNAIQMMCVNIVELFLQREKERYELIKSVKLKKFISPTNEVPLG